jgi:hypothetical protein
MSHYNAFDKLIISYDTGPVPPPFCYRYRLEVTTADQQQFSVKLKIDYYDRDEISEDEILLEGYSLNDNFAWHGDLPAVWAEELQRRIVATNWVKKADRSDMAEFNLKLVSEGKSELLYPADIRSWEVLAQEVIQAIFELSNKEAPLHLLFRHVDENLQKHDLSMTYQFSDRKVLSDSHRKNAEVMGWDEGQKLLKYIFQFDYLPEQAQSGEPKNAGHYISPGDGMWYTLDEVYQGESKNNKDRLIMTLKSYLKDRGSFK